MIDHRLVYNKKTYIGQAKACLKVCKRFFDILKRIGVFDDCMIIVVGDHGSGRTKDMYIDPSDDRRLARFDSVSQNGNFQYDKARGCPLILVKRFKEKGELKTSQSPVALTDIPQTIFGELGIRTRTQGISMFEVPEDSSRERYYGAFYYTLHNRAYEGPITRYVVKGPVWSDASWDADAILYPKGVVKSLRVGGS